MDYRNKELKKIGKTMLVEGERIVGSSGVVYVFDEYTSNDAYMHRDDGLIPQTFFSKAYVGEYFFFLDENPVSVGELKIGDTFRGEDLFEYVIIENNGGDFVKVVNLNTGGIETHVSTEGLKYSNISGTTI